MRRWAHFASTIAVGEVRLGAVWFRYSKSRLELRDHELGVDAVAAMLAQSGYPYAACRKLVLERLRPGDLAGRDVLTERVLQCIAALRTLCDAEEKMQEVEDEAPNGQQKRQSEETKGQNEESKEQSRESKDEPMSDVHDGSRRSKKSGQDSQPFEDVHALIAATTFRNDEVKRTSFQVIINFK